MPTLNTPRIRVAHTSDAEVLAALAERTFRDTFADDNSAQNMDAYMRSAFSLTRTRAELADSANTFLLAYRGDTPQPVGYAKLRSGLVDENVHGPDPVELQRIYVDRDTKGGGVGTTLMRASLDKAQVMGYRTLWLGVWEHNPLAISFYERSHFKAVGNHIFTLGTEDQKDLIMVRPVVVQG